MVVSLQRCNTVIFSQESHNHYFHTGIHVFTTLQFICNIVMNSHSNDETCSRLALNLQSNKIATFYNTIIFRNTSQQLICEQYKFYSGA